MSFLLLDKRWKDFFCPVSPQCLVILNKIKTNFIPPFYASFFPSLCVLNSCLDNWIPFSVVWSEYQNGFCFYANTYHCTVSGRALGFRGGTLTAVDKMLLWYFKKENSTWPKCIQCTVVWISPISKCNVYWFKTNGKQYWHSIIIYFCAMYLYSKPHCLLGTSLIDLKIVNLVGKIVLEYLIRLIAISNRNYGASYVICTQSGMFVAHNSILFLFKQR